MTQYQGLWAAGDTATDGAGERSHPAGSASAAVVIDSLFSRACPGPVCRLTPNPMPD